MREPAHLSAREKTIEDSIQALASDDRFAREAARSFLVRAGRSVVPALSELLGDSRNHLRWEAVKALAEMEDAEAADALVRALEDEDSGVRWVAAEGLIALETEAIPALLQALTARSSSVWLRRGAHHVIRGLPMWKLVTLLRPILDALEDSTPESQVPVVAQRALESLTTGRSSLTGE